MCSISASNTGDELVHHRSCSFLVKQKFSCRREHFWTETFQSSSIDFNLWIGTILNFKLINFLMSLNCKSQKATTEAAWGSRSNKTAISMNHVLQTRWQHAVAISEKCWCLEKTISNYLHSVPTRNFLVILGALDDRTKALSKLINSLANFFCRLCRALSSEHPTTLSSPLSHKLHVQLMKNDQLNFVLSKHCFGLNHIWSHIKESRLEDV